MNWINIVMTITVILMLLSLVIYNRKDKNSQRQVRDLGDVEELKSISHKLIVPLKLQAYERLLLYVERIQFPVLVKRVFYTGMSRNDFQFSLLQNVQDEYEHNIAQRLYVTEETWQLVDLSKEEVLQNINAVFNDNPDADVTMIAQKLASFSNPMVEKAVINIKREFNSL